VTRSYWPVLFTLAALWGASYLFIKVGVDGGFEPAQLMSARAGIAAVLLFGYLASTLGARRAIVELRGSWRKWVTLGIIGNAIPFWLVAWGETHIDSGIAAIAQSTIPMFTILLGLRFLPHEPLGPLRATGIALGLVGVAVLAGGGPDAGAWAVVGTLAVVLASLSYAGGNVVGQRSVSGTSGPVLATGAMLAASLFLLPLAIVQLPERRPDLDAIGSLLALAVVGTAMAQLVLYRGLRLFGGRRLSLVTYLMPGFALVYGAVLLDEQVTPWALLGLGLILAGVALGSGAHSLRGRTTPVAEGTGQ
jgi:drug/metabolite transporter (DMT)-like permease